MQRTMRPAWIAGLWAMGLLAAGCAGTPAPRQRVEEAGVPDVTEEVDVARPGGDEHRRPPVPRRVERTSVRRDDPKPRPRHGEADEPAIRPDEPTPPDAEPTRSSGDGPETPSRDRGAPPGDGPVAVPREDRDRPDPGDGPAPAPDDAACPEPDVLTEQADLVHAAATRPGPAAPGFAGLALSTADCRIDLWWHGPVPSTVTAAVEPIDGVDGADGLHVVTHAAAHSAVELATGADALTTERLVTLPDQPPVTVAIEAVIPRQDGVGIDVEITLEPGPAGPADPSGRRLAERVAASLTERVGLPVFVEVVADPPAELGRVDEPNPAPPPSRSPGGERSYHPVPGRSGAFTACTTGFPVRGRDGEGPWLLTADHCTGGADGMALDGDHAPIGAVTEHRPGLDSTRIAVVDAGGGAGDDRALVRGPAANYPGKSVCQAGATSGEVCDLVIRQVDRRQWSEALGTYVRQVVQAEHAHGGRAAQPGDSGAPVYRTSTDGEIEAQGILVMGHPADTADTADTDTIYYVDIQALLTAWHADLDEAATPPPPDLLPPDRR